MTEVRDGDLVTVRALWPMPGVPDGSVQTVTAGPRLIRLIAQQRYEVISVTPTATDPAPAGKPAAAAKTSTARAEKQSAKPAAPATTGEPAEQDTATVPTQTTRAKP